jgi:hypothetical protein
MFDLKKVATAARKLYRREVAKTGSTIVDPGSLYREVAASLSYPESRVLAPVARTIYSETGAANPLAVGPKSAASAVANAVVRRRNAGGTLGRWDVLRVSLAVSLGRPVSIAALKALYEAGTGILAGFDRDGSYIGRGTRVGAPRTYLSEVEELALVRADRKTARAAKLAAKPDVAPATDGAPIA